MLIGARSSDVKPKIGSLDTPGSKHRRRDPAHIALEPGLGANRVPNYLLAFLEDEQRLRTELASEFGPERLQHIEELTASLGRRGDVLSEVDEVIALLPPSGSNSLGRAWVESSLARCCLELHVDDRFARRCRARARDLLTRSLAPGPLTQFAHAWARGAMALGFVLLRESEYATADTRRSHLDAAEQWSRDAANALRPLGLPCAFSLSEALLLLGEVVAAEQRHPEAMPVLIDGWRTFQQRYAAGNPMFPNPEGIEDLGLKLAVTIGTVALEVGTQPHLGHARSVLREASSADHPSVDLQLARITEALGQPLADLPSRIALGVNRLTRPELQVAAPIIARSCAPDERRAFFVYAIDHLVTIRNGRASDAEVDHVTAEAQDLARMWAQLLAPSLPIDAFRTIEANAALRLGEAVELHGWVPEDPAAAADYSAWRHLSARKQICADYALRLSGCTFAQLERERRLCRSQTEGTELDENDARAIPIDQLDAPPVLESADFQALSVELPFDEALLRRATELDEHATEVRLRLEHDPSFMRAREQVTRPVTEAGLCQLLREYAGHAFLRLEPCADGILALYIDGEGPDGIRGRATLVPLDMAELDGAASALADGGEPDAASRVLASVRLGEILPERTAARLVLLPSPRLSVLPLCALGADGDTLLDRFEALCWNLSLAPLRTRVVERWPRKDTAVLAPGTDRQNNENARTTFHEIALTPLVSEEKDNVLGDTDPAALAKAIRSARVFRFYGHGEHPRYQPRQSDWMHGPSIILGRSDRFTMKALAPVSFGLERVELWACRSGIDRPSDPLFTEGVDGFGLDFGFLRAGARSTVATLWAVDDLVTSYIVLRFRVGLARGTDAARALADAQRWWSRHGRLALAGAESNEAVADRVLRVWRLALDGETTTPDAEARVRDAARLTQTLNGALSPIAHAAYRFSGVPGRQAEAVWPKVSPDKLVMP